MQPDRNQPSAVRARRAMGAMFFVIFGAIWLVVWSQRAFGLRPAVLAPIVLLASALFWTAFRQYQLHRAAQAAEADSPASKRAARIFNIVNVTQWVTILVAGNVLANVGLGAWVIPSAMLIIGIHFFPLASAFGNPTLNLTGAGMIALAAVYPFVAPGGAANPVGCLGSGLILWASALRSLTS